MLLKTFINNSVSELSALYPKEEARSMVIMLCQERLGVMSYTHIVEPGTAIPDEELPLLQEDIAQMAEGKPIQYILGYTEFCGRVFNIDERALIPRAESELLVWNAEKAVEGMEGPLSIVDLCTGSGCIAWTLALDLKGSKVVATDLSAEALELARGQFKRLPKGAVRPEFKVADLLDFSVELPQCNLITANPPYIMVEEKSIMRPNVLDYEPNMALFAPEDDPLCFHKAIALWGKRLLLPGGVVVSEINEVLGEESAAVFKAAGYEDVKVVNDFYDKPRFVVASLLKR